MYAPGKILYAGGGFTTNTAEIIDLNLAPDWRCTGRWRSRAGITTSTLLPTGEVLATGGVAGTSFNDLTQPVLRGRDLEPHDRHLAHAREQRHVRGYHGTSILLPDGRVLNSGSGDGAGAPGQLNAEMFSPPYLFAGPRPTIGSAPRRSRYGRTFTVSTPKAATSPRSA